MRVTGVSVAHCEVPFREPFAAGDQAWHRRCVSILTLTADEGYEGRGELVWPPLPDSAAGSPEAVVVAAMEGLSLVDAEAVEAALRRLDETPAVGRAARAAAESALVELLARAQGRSVAAFLGTRPATDVAVNATLPLASPEATARAARDLADAGFTCLKLKAGREPVDELAARLAAVREAAGDRVALRVDLNGSLDVPTAETVLARLARFDLEYVEQPIPPSAGWEALAHLRWTGAVPIAADESVLDVGSSRALIDAGAVDALVVKPARVGGLRQAAAIVELATASAVPVTLSTHFETGIGLAGALHVAAIAPGPQAHGLATADLLEADLLSVPLSISRGRMRLPAGAGLGVALDHEAIARYGTP